MTSAPKRARSYRLAAVDINSIPQQAVAKGIGQSELRRAQLTTLRSCVATNVSAGSAVSSPIARFLICVRQVFVEL
jgi:hypothetical protein